MDNSKNESNFHASGVTFEEATFASLGIDPSIANQATDDISSMRKDQNDKRKTNH